MEFGIDKRTACHAQHNLESMDSFKDKHIIVTGGIKGIGRACVEVFLKAGSKVTVFDIDNSIDQLEGNEDNCTYYKIDVAQEKQVNEGIQASIHKFGEVDILVNNAGIVRYASVTETSEEVWDEILGVNLKSYFLCAKHAIPSMLKKGKGVVINVSSVQAFLSQHMVAAYTASKSAILGLTRSIAIDYAPHVRCVAVCPGTIDTPMYRNGLQESPHPEEVHQECIDMHPLKRLGTPEQVAELIAFLASDKASFITGQSYRIDGGLGIMVAGSKQE